MTLHRKAGNRVGEISALIRLGSSWRLLVRGEGLMGLTRGFLYAGVPRVVASLWPVQDKASRELMTRFYRAMWRDGQSPAAALRQAQRSMRRDPRYRNPFFWAGFVLQGDWR